MRPRPRRIRQMSKQNFGIVMFGFGLIVGILVGMVIGVFLQ